MAIYSITHISDFDGMASAAMVMRTFGVSKSDLIFGTYSKQSFEYTRRFVESKKGINTFIITDIGMNEWAIPYYRKMVKELTAKGNRVLWVDHHMWSNDAIEQIGTQCALFVGDENKILCATELAYRIFCRDDRQMRRLVSIVHYADFNLPSEKYQKMLRDFAYAIAYLGFDNDFGSHQLKNIVADLSQGKLLTPRIKKFSKLYQKESKQNTDKLLKSTQIVQNRYRIGIGFSRRLHSTAACMTMMEHFKLDIALFVDTDDATVKCRSRKGVSALQLASYMGGGGHPQACGFTMGMRPDNFSKEGRQRCLNIIKKAVAKVYR